MQSANHCELLSLFGAVRKAHGVFASLGLQPCCLLVLRELNLLCHAMDLEREVCSAANVDGRWDGQILSNSKVDLLLGQHLRFTPCQLLHTIKRDIGKIHTRWTVGDNV